MEKIWETKYFMFLCSSQIEDVQIITQTETFTQISVCEWPTDWFGHRSACGHVVVCLVHLTATKQRGKNRFPTH